MDWDDLSDDELRRRLIQRGVMPEIAAYLVNRRDYERYAREITQELEH